MYIKEFDRYHGLRCIVLEIELFFSLMVNPSTRKIFDDKTGSLS